MPRRPRRTALVAVLTAIVAGLAVAPGSALAAPSARPAVERPAAVPDRHAFLVGDSVMAGMGANALAIIRGGGWQVTPELTTCRRLVAPSCGSPQPATALQVIQARRAEIHDVVVIGVGYNDWSGRFRSDVRQIMGELADVDLVLWLTYKEQTADYAAMNRILREEAAGFPNLQILDWNAASAANPGWFATWDGARLHLNATGGDGMAGLILGALEPWHRARACTPGPDTNPPGAPSPASARGYWMLDSGGRVHAFGDAPTHGDLVSRGVTVPPASMQATPSGQGYWIVDQRGAVHAFGDAPALGDLTGVALNGPVLRIEGHRKLPGYWLVASDGGVFAFGVPFLGSMGATRLNAPVISMHAAETGYWLVASDGGVFSFRVPFHGSTGDRRLNSPVISMAVDPADAGYWLYAADGGVFSFGVPFLGSVPGTGLCDVPPTVAMRATATGHGYWVVTVTGRVFAFGDAMHFGDQPALGGARIVDFAVRR